MPSIIVTRLHLHTPPLLPQEHHVFVESANVDSPRTLRAIGAALLPSLSSGNILSYHFQNDENGVVFHHKKSDRERIENLGNLRADLNDRHAHDINLLKDQIEQLKHDSRLAHRHIEKLRQGAQDAEHRRSISRRFEVYTRLAKVINKETLQRWQLSSDSNLAMLPQDLARDQIYLPVALTADSIYYEYERKDFDETFFDPSRYYSGDGGADEYYRYLAIGKKNREQGMGGVLNAAWNGFDPTDLKLMLIAWALRETSSRNVVAHETPTMARVEFAQALINRDLQDPLRERASTLINRHFFKF